MPLREIAFFIFGITVGSFLNVVIDRLPNNKSIVKGRSCCDFCKKTLQWYDLIPLLSFLLLKGKCRYCRRRLSFQYPAVEFITGISFVFTYIYSLTNFQHNPNFGYFLGFSILLVSTLIVIFVTDLKFGIIQDKILLFLFFFSLIFQIIFIGQALFLNLLSGLGAFLFFLILYFITKQKGLGFGDVKFAFLIGFLVGFPNVVTALYMAFLTGAFTSIILVLWKKKRFSNTVPFGPFLAMSLLIAYFWGDGITRFVLKIFGF